MIMRDMLTPNVVASFQRAADELRREGALYRLFENDRVATVEGWSREYHDDRWVTL